MFQSTNKISENKILHRYRVFKSQHLKSSKMFCHFEASLVAPFPAGGLLPLLLLLRFAACSLGLLIREVLGGLGMWGREGGKMGGTNVHVLSCLWSVPLDTWKQLFWENHIYRWSSVGRHWLQYWRDHSLVTVRQTVQCLPPSQQPACGTQGQDCHNDPQEEHVGHGGEIRKYDQYRVKVDRSDQTTLRKCLFLLHREETIKHT